MEIDFHHTVIYVLSRLAGFEKGEAEIISASSQFVDDAIWDVPLFFETGEVYKPISSAHKTLDYRNFVDLANRLSWVTFHFLPGDVDISKSISDSKSFESKLICRPNSLLSQDMMHECIRRREDSNSLYRLGIAIHSYADTWSHQGFSGIQSKTNKVAYLDNEEIGKKLLHKVRNYFGEIIDSSIGNVIDRVLPLGHGSVLSYPDKPYLKWNYIDYNGKIIQRDNSELFMDAARNIFNFLNKFKNCDNPSASKIFSVDLQDKIFDIMKNSNNSNANIRHNVWLEKISNNEFKFGHDTISYDIQNNKSWEFQAFGELITKERKKYKFSKQFEESHWKKFHDALHDHHYHLNRVLFPKYNLCVS